MEERVTRVRHYLYHGQVRILILQPDLKLKYYRFNKPTHALFLLQKKNAMIITGYLVSYRITSVQIGKVIFGKVVSTVIKLQSLMDRTSNNFKGNQYQNLIQKFKDREEQTSIQQALVYLKLRENHCDHRRSLIFSKKKQKCIDGTIHKDGPSEFRKLEVLKPQSKLINGWLRGQKHRYFGTTGYTDFLKKHESVEKKSITSYNQKSRQFQETLRKARSKSTVTIDMTRPKESLQKIGVMKQDASKERQNRNMYVEYSGVRLDQTTKNFFKETQNLNDQGLIMKLGAFQHIIGDKQLSLKLDATNMKGKTLTNFEVEGQNKRDKIISYQDKVKNYTQNYFHKPKNEDSSWKRLIHTKLNQQNQLLFTRKTLAEASNPLILAQSKQLKRQLVQNEKKFTENITKYSNFYQDVEKAVKIDFLSKRRYSQPTLQPSQKKINVTPSP